MLARNIDLTESAQMTQTGSRTVTGSPSTSRLPCSAYGGPRWHVIEAEPGKIHLACRSLIEQRFETFLATTPMRMRKTVNGRQESALSIVHVPMFFGFFFCRFDAEREQWPKRDTRLGIARLLMTTNNRPAPVERGLVERLIETAPERLNLPKEARPKLTPNIMILIVKGAFEGMTGQVVSCDGFSTVVRLVMFGGYRDVRINRADITTE